MQTWIADEPPQGFIFEFRICNSCDVILLWFCSDDLLLWKLLINARMRDLWVRHELIHGMLRRLGSFLRCDDTLVDSGSRK